MQRALRHHRRAGDRPPGWSGVPKVLVLSDASDSREILDGLHSADFAPVLALTEEQALRWLRVDEFSIVIVDSGGRVDLGRRVAMIGVHGVPILVVGGQATEFLPGVGVERHLTGEPAVQEVVGCALGIVRLRRPVALPSLRWGGLELDVKRRCARWKGIGLSLTVTEFRIMEVLILSAGAVVPVNDLVRRVWGCEAFEDTERLGAHIRRIRRKIEESPSEPAFLLTVRGEGYRLADQGEHLAERFQDEPADRLLWMTAP